LIDLKTIYPEVLLASKEKTSAAGIFLMKVSELMAFLQYVLASPVQLSIMPMLSFD
jgi:hypothetical protein